MKIAVLISRILLGLVFSACGVVSLLPASLRRSLTWDRGLEMAKHKTFTVATKVNV